MRKNYLSFFTAFKNELKAKSILVIMLIVSVYGTTNAQNCTVNAGVTQTVCENETLTLYGGVSGISVGPGNLDTNRGSVSNYCKPKCGTNRYHWTNRRHFTNF